MTHSRPLTPVLIVGGRNSGKTTYARTLAERARRAGWAIAGFLSEAEWEGDVKARYFLRDLADPATRTLLAAREPLPGLDSRVGRHFLSRTALAAAYASLRRSLAADLICIDEFGPLELRGGGFRPAFHFLLQHYRGILLITVRPALQAAVLGLLRSALAAPPGGCRPWPRGPDST